MGALRFLLGVGLVRKINACLKLVKSAQAVMTSLTVVLLNTLAKLVLALFLAAGIVTGVGFMALECHCLS